MVFEPQERPIGVTVVEALLYIQALINVIAGLLWVVDRNTLEVQVQTGFTSDELALAGFTLILAGFFFAWVAYDLGAGGEAARWIITVVASLHIFAALWILLTTEGAARNDLMAQGILSLIVILLLHTDAAERFFHQRTHL